MSAGRRIIGFHVELPYPDRDSRSQLKLHFLLRIDNCSTFWCVFSRNKMPGGRAVKQHNSKTQTVSNTTARVGKPKRYASPLSLQSLLGSLIRSIRGGQHSKSLHQSTDQILGYIRNKSWGSSRRRSRNSVLGLGRHATQTP